MLPHSRSNETACYMLRTQPTCTHLACRTPAHTHTRLHREQLARKAGRKERTPAERASSDRNWALNRTKYNTKPNSNLFHSIFFFFFSFSGSLECRHTMQTAKRVYRQRCYEMQLKEMASQGWRKETRMGKKKKKHEQDERERRLISTLRSPSLTAPAQSLRQVLPMAAH